MWPSASFVDVHDKVEVCPDRILVGLKDAVHEGAVFTVTVAVHVFVVPELFCTVSVHV